MSTEVKKATEVVPSVVSKEAMEKGIAKVTEELKTRAIANIDPQHKPEVKKAEVKKAEVKKPEVKKAEVKKAEVKKVDIQPLLKVIPDTFTPALLDKLFNLNDGGKTVRRHLRKHFAEAMKHEHKDKWGFTKANVDILQYFANRYAYDLKVLEPATKTA